MNELTERRVFESPVKVFGTTFDDSVLPALSLPETFEERPVSSPLVARNVSVAVREIGPKRNGIAPDTRQTHLHRGWVNDSDRRTSGYPEDNRETYGLFSWTGV